MNKFKKNLIYNSNKVVINSKNISQGDIFIALLGENNHGNSYIDQALNNGAKYILTDRQPKEKNYSKKIIIVENILDFLLLIAKEKRNLFQGKVVGVTGSVGKTSVKENLKYFLSPYYKISASIKSYNNYLGVIISLLNLDLKSKYAIFELGTNNFSEIQNLTSIVNPNQIIITNIFPTHLENLLSTRKIAEEKSDIFNKDFNSKVELAILSNNNIDEKFIIEKAKKQEIANILTFGKKINSDLFVSSIEAFDISYSKVSVIFKEQKIIFFINKNQILKLENLLICLLFFIYNKIFLEKFLSLSRNIPFIEGRGDNKKIILDNKKINIIDESYNASPQTMKICIDYLNNLKISKNQKKILILGEMKELGEHSIKFHQDLIEHILESDLDNIIICGELFKIALEKKDNNKILYMSDITQILNYILKIINHNDILLIKGSNSSLTNKLASELLKKEII